MASETITTIKKGQIWRVVDPRFERFIRIISFCHYPDQGKVFIETVYPKKRTDAGFGKWFFGDWNRKPKSRSGSVLISRLHGKRGGYEYVE